MLSNGSWPLVAAAVAGATGGWLIGAGGAWGALLVGVAGLAVWVLRRPPARESVVAVTLLVVAAALSGAVGAARPVGGAVVGAVSALVVTAGATLCGGVVAALRHRAAHRRLGWELARVLEEQERSRTQEILTAERVAMAGEIHDRLGHRLTLIAVRLGRLSLDETVPADARDAVERIRAEAAAAAAELGETVTLLKSGRGAELTPAVRSLRQVVEGVDGSLEVTADLPDGFEDRMSPHARAAFERVLTEALTNAAKHAPGQPVTVAADVDGDVARLVVRNAVVAPPAGSQTPAASSGHGLTSLRLRLELLGGDLRVRREGELMLDAQVPLDAAPTVPTVLPAPTAVDVAERDVGARARDASRRAWRAPAALAAAAALFAVGYFAFVTVASVLPVERYEELQVGTTQLGAEELLPATEMLEPPRDELPEPSGASCRYFEASVSPFRRDDVHRVCFTDGIVSHLDVIPAP